MPTNAPASARSIIAYLLFGACSGLTGCGRAPTAAPGNPAPVAVAQPSKAEFLALLSAKVPSGAPARFTDVTLEAAGPPEPGSGRQALGYRATLEIADALYVLAVPEPVFAREKFDLPRWEAARLALKSELRAATVRAAHLEEAAPKEQPQDLVLLREVVAKGQRHTVWGRATVVHQVDRWELLERESSRVEPPLREDANPRSAFVAQHGADEVFLETDRAGLRRWAEGWDDFSRRTEAALAAQRAADAARVARYQRDPAGYLAAHRWSLGSATWDRTTNRYNVTITGEPATFQPGSKVSFLPYHYQWRMEADGSVFLKHPDSFRGFRLSAVQVVGGEGDRLALAEPLTPDALGTTSTAIVEAAR